MTILEILLRSAAADLSLCLKEAERTGDPEWQRLAAQCRAQCEDYSHAMA